MYFSLLPDVQYDKKPISYPFSEADYVTAKNFFRRWKINEKVFDSVVYYKKYTIQDGDRPDTIANDLYDNPFYDWVIILTNNIINPTFNWPMSEYQLRKYIELIYGEDVYSEIHHYESLEVKDNNGNIVLPSGLTVDKNFYDSPLFKIDNATQGLPTSIVGQQARAYVVFDRSYVSAINVTSAGSGYETEPIVTITDSQGGNGATARAILSDCGYIKRLSIDNPGFGYTFPPVVTLGGGLAGQSATAEIQNGIVTNIVLDGIKYDTTNADQIYQFSTGTTIAPNGTGVGSLGGFNIGSPHLRFGGSSGARFVILNPINATAINTVRVYAVRGNGRNGGETPDINGEEDLYIQYQITNPGDAPDPNAWINLGIVIDAVPNGSGSGVLDNYDFDLSGTDVQAENVYFRLYQPFNSGPNFDHYGILSVTFIGDASVIVCNPTIEITPNPLQSTPPSVEARASIVLGKTIDRIEVIDQGFDYTPSSVSVSLSGGSYNTEGSAQAVVENRLSITLSDPGYAYENATIELIGGGGFGASAQISTGSNKIQSVSITSNGSGYIEPPTPVISAPDKESILKSGDIYTNNNNVWRYNGSAWEKQITDGFKYWDGTGVVEAPGNSVSKPITIFEYESEKNEKNREIYLLKKELLTYFIEEFKSNNLYKTSNDFVSSRLKKTGN